MFEQTLIAPPAGSRRAWSTLMGFTTQSVLLTAAVLVPLIYPDALPRMPGFVTIFTPGAPPPPPPQPVRIETATAAAPRPTQFRNDVLQAPLTIPAKPQILEDPPIVSAGPAGSGVQGGVIGGIPGVGGGGGLPASIVRSVPEPAPPAQDTRQAATASKPPERIERIQVGGKVQEAMIVHRVIPAYPQLARAARVSGIVQLVGVIGTDGRIQELRVTGGHPLLVKAAVDAVRQWVYRPTLLNGVPVEVLAPITVTFTLN